MRRSQVVSVVGYRMFFMLYKCVRIHIIIGLTTRLTLMISLRRIISSCVLRIIVNLHSLYAAM